MQSETARAKPVGWREWRHPYLRVLACVVCREPLREDNRIEGGYVVLWDETHVMAAFHRECDTPERCEAMYRAGGFSGSWEPWMGLDLGEW